MSTSEKTCSKSPATLEQMSSADLEALLLLDFQSQAEEGADMSGLFRAAEVLAQREYPQHSKSTTGADQAWETFLEKYLPFAEAGSSLYGDAEAPSASAAAVQPQPPPFRRRRRGLRAACLAAILAAAMLLAAISGDITRETLKEMIDSLYPK